ncbi:MAG: hypothetical protein HQL69_11355 [Magnetococcales bacterium]|nr:hypothetical protein [Magnetococcales bacterium]
MDNFRLNNKESSASVKEENSRIVDWFVNMTGFKMTPNRMEMMEMIINHLSIREKLSPEKYKQSLLDGSISGQTFIDSLLPSHSKFFQDRSQIDLVVLRLLPTLLAKRPGSPVRILSIGCIQGEEPYSLALLIHEAGIFPSLVEIQGIGFSKSSINRGKSGVFQAGAIDMVSQEIRQQFFTPISSDQHQLNSTIRNQVTLTWSSIVEEESSITKHPFDIVFCRHLLPQLTPEARNRLLLTLYDTLSEDGVLMLDANSGFLGLAHFQPFQLEGSWIYRKKAETLSTNISAEKNSMSAEKNRSQLLMHRAKSSLKGGNFERAIQQYDGILARHSHNAPQALFGKSQALLKLGKYREALDASQVALEIDQETNALDSGRRSALKSLIKNLVKKKVTNRNSLLTGVSPFTKNLRWRKHLRNSGTFFPTYI